jgi:glycosyltransferase involved in cell wall biosynthesis
MFNGLQYVFAIPEDTPLIIQMGGDLRRSVYYDRVNLELLECNSQDKQKLTVNYINNREKTKIISDKYENRQIYNKMIYSTNLVPVIDVKDQKRVKNSVIWVGRLSEEKNPLLLLEIAEKLPNYHFTMVLAVPNDFSHVPAMPDNVELYINLIDHFQIAMLYARSEILLNTSETEGQPLTVREGMSQGCFVIGGQAVWGDSNHTVTDMSADGFVRSIKGYSSLDERQKQFYVTKNKSRSPSGATKLRVADIVRMYKGMCK